MFYNLDKFLSFLTIDFSVTMGKILPTYVSVVHNLVSALTLGVRLTHTGDGGT